MTQPGLTSKVFFLGGYAGPRVCTEDVMIVVAKNGTENSCSSSPNLISLILIPSRCVDRWDKNKIYMLDGHRTRTMFSVLELNAVLKKKKKRYRLHSFEAWWVFLFVGKHFSVD